MVIKWGRWPMDQSYRVEALENTRGTKLTRGDVGPGTGTVERPYPPLTWDALQQEGVGLACEVEAVTVGQAARSGGGGKGKGAGCATEGGRHHNIVGLAYHAGQGPRWDGSSSKCEVSNHG